MNESLADTARHVMTHALHWLHDNHELGGFSVEVTADLDDPNSVYKPLGEMALAASLILRADTSSAAERNTARELLDFVWNQLRGGDLLYERKLRHVLLTDPLETYVHFLRGGYRHTGLERLLAHAVKLRSVHNVETVPNRKLAVANAARLAGVDHGTDWAALTRATWLGNTPEPWAIDWLTAYNTTHTVFHCTNWGAHPEALPADLADYLHSWLPVWLDIWVEVQQWDLVGELLTVDACLPAPHNDATAWNEFAAAQRSDGLVPRDGEPVTEDPELRFLNHQHTAVVAIVAGTVLRSSGNGSVIPG